MSLFRPSPSNREMTLRGLITMLPAAQKRGVPLWFLCAPVLDGKEFQPLRRRRERRPSWAVSTAAHDVMLTIAHFRALLFPPTVVDFISSPCGGGRISLDYWLSCTQLLSRQRAELLPVLARHALPDLFVLTRAVEPLSEAAWKAWIRLPDMGSAWGRVMFFILRNDDQQAAETFLKEAAYVVPVQPDLSEHLLEDLRYLGRCLSVHRPLKGSVQTRLRAVWTLRRWLRGDVVPWVVWCAYRAPERSVPSAVHKRHRACLYDAMLRLHDAGILLRLPVVFNMLPPTEATWAALDLMLLSPSWEEQLLEKKARTGGPEPGKQEVRPEDILDELLAEAQREKRGY